MRFNLILSLSIAILLVTVSNLRSETTQLTPTPTRAGEWLQFRGDRQLTGRSSLKGNIVLPAILWRHFIGARETLLQARFSPQTTSDPPGKAQTVSAALPTVDVEQTSATALAHRWELGGSWLDLDGKGSPAVVAPSTSYKVGHLLPAESGAPVGWQKIEFESAFAKSGTSADNVPVYGRLSQWKEGRWQQLWQSERIPLLYAANTIYGDFDADGQMEIALVPWYDVWVLDAATGKLRSKARFAPPDAESGRAYGWFGAFDFDGDGKQEFVILADFENHIDVLGWKDGALQPLWNRLIERGITRKGTILHPGTDPVQDIDGDGKPEIVVSIFNANGDGAWHIEGISGMTGKTVFDLPGHYLSGLRDIDNDGTAELFCTRTPGQLIPERAHLSVLSFKNRQSRTLWEEEHSQFQTHEISDFPPNVNSGAATGRTTLLTGSAHGVVRPVFFTRKSLDGSGNRVAGSTRIQLESWQADTSGKIVRRGSLTGPRLEAVAVRFTTAAPAEVLVRATVTGGLREDVRASGASLQVVRSQRVAAPLSTVVGGRLNGKEMTLVAQGANEQLVAFQTPRKSRLKPKAKLEPRPLEQWRAAGRGMFTGSVHEGGGAPFGGVALADLTGNGTLSTLAATRSPEGHARLIALDTGGREKWHHDFAQLGGAPPIWNVGGLTMWFPGRFTDQYRDDVLVTIRHNTMHSDEAFLLDGRDGHVLWRRSEGGHTAHHQRACGGSWMAIYDYDRDGLDDALCLYPDVFFVLHGPTGKIIFNRSSMQDIFPGVWAFYAMPVVADFLGDGRKQVLYGASTYMLGLLEQDGKALWSKGLNEGTPAVPASLGDIDGDGKPELLSPGHCNKSDPSMTEFHCYETAAGALKWKLDLPGACFTANNGFVAMTPMTPVSGDVDGDGRDECIFPIGKTLYAIGATREGKAGQIVWKLDLPDIVGPAAILDTDGSGRAQIVVTCADGYVYGVGAA